MTIIIIFIIIVLAMLGIPLLNALTAGERDLEMPEEFKRGGRLVSGANDRYTSTKDLGAFLGRAVIEEGGAVRVYRDNSPRPIGHIKPNKNTKQIIAARGGSIGLRGFIIEKNGRTSARVILDCDGAMGFNS